MDYWKGITGCGEAKRLFDGERSLRERAKRETDVYVAAEIANVALLVQRRRHVHQGTCHACLIETRRAAA